VLSATVPESFISSGGKGSDALVAATWIFEVARDQDLLVGLKRRWRRGPGEGSPPKRLHLLGGLPGIAPARSRIGIRRR